LGGFAAAGGLFITNFILKKLMYKHTAMSKFIQGEPLLLVYNGQVKHKALQAAQLSQAELEAAIREHGFENIEHVKLVVLEVDGNISVIAKDSQAIGHKKRKTRKILR
jgi:uncharacterized membrane protein YcaP (DUF421 family)